MTVHDWADDFYEILQVQHSATQNLIRAAYRQLAKDNNIDTNPGDEESTRRLTEIHKRINAAYEVLGKPELREQYDRMFGFDKPAGGGGRAGAGASKAGPTAASGAAPDRPELEIDPAHVSLSPSPGARESRFHVVARQVGGPTWVAGKHVLDLVFEAPWDPSMFSRVEISPDGPPFRIDFDVRLPVLEPDTRYSGGLRIEVRVVT
jgi:curved DNA-binding protein CbpA